jgi:hypothetical protein
MLVLDENLPESQCQRLRNWRMRFRIIGVEIAAWGTRDENLIPVLHRLPNPTFFSLDRDFYRPAWKHASYCLVWLNIPDNHAADFIRRFLRHPASRHRKRMGIVARVHAEGV